MPPKRPLEENPPSASASDDESEEEGSEEEQETPKPKPIQSSTKLPPPPKPPSSSDDEDDDDDEEEEEEEEDNMEEEKAKPTADDDNDEEDDDDDDSESGSGSGSESDNEPVKHMIASRTAEVKPISSKPMSDIPKSKKPTSTNTAPPKPKRPSEEENDRKRKKKKVADIEDGGDEESQKKAAPAGGEEKKQLFQRVWTNEDEIILLNSLKDFKREGHNAATDMAGFHGFVKDSLHIDVTKAQLANKIQRLEKKFKNNASRAKEPGKDPVISKPHEWKSYQLSKEIWGEQSGKDHGAETHNVGGEVGVTERKRKKTQVKNNGIASPKGKVAKSAKSPKVEHIEEEDTVKKEDGAGRTVEYPYLNQSMCILNNPVLPVPPPGLVGLFAKKGWNSIGTSKAEAFDQKWKAVLTAETKAYLERVDVVRDQTKLMLEVLESSDV